MFSLDRLLARLRPEELDRIEPRRWGGTFGLSEQCVADALARRRRALADLALPRVRPEQSED